MILKETSDPEKMWRVYDSGISQLFLTTANSTMNLRTQKLVMGAGHAKQVADRFPKLPAALIRGIEEQVTEYILAGYWKDNVFQDYLYNDKAYRVYGDYFLLISPRWPKARLGLFQVKRGWWWKGEAYKEKIQSIVHYSTKQLQKFCSKFPLVRVDMPYPAIGNGGLSVEDIEPIIRRLPDSVYVWKLI